MSNPDGCSPLVVRELFPVILREVCVAYEVAPSDVLSKSRVHAYCEPRRVVWWLCRVIGVITYEGIGELTGGRHHTSVMHGCELVEQLRNKSDFHRRKIDEIWASVVGYVEPIVGKGVLAGPGLVAA